MERKIDLKSIHIGYIIKQRVLELGIETSRICNFLNCNDEDLVKMYDSENLESHLLLRWSKLLEYDFFRIYSQHLILYAPSAFVGKYKGEKKESKALPNFRKNLYTHELILFILELINTNKKTKQEVITDYRIPKTTLYKWIEKFK